MASQKGEDQSPQLILLRRIDERSVVSMKIPVRTDPAIAEKLFPREIFGKDPYNVNPSDDNSWLQSDWGSMLGGFHWEHSVPQVKDEDTELPK